MTGIKSVIICIMAAQRDSSRPAGKGCVFLREEDACCRPSVCLRGYEWFEAAYAVMQ